MAKIAIVRAVASDLTGVRGEEAEFGKLTVRRHPALNGTAKVLDIKPDEIEGLEQIGDVVFLDYEPPPPQRWSSTSTRASSGVSGLRHWQWRHQTENSPSRRTSTRPLLTMQLSAYDAHSD